MRHSEIDSIANEVSNMVIDRVLAGDLSISEALVGILTSPIFICAKTLPDEKVKDILEQGGLLAKDVLDCLEETTVSPAVLVYGLSLVSRAIIENTKK